MTQSLSSQVVFVIDATPSLRHIYPALYESYVRRIILSITGISDSSTTTLQSPDTQLSNLVKNNTHYGIVFYGGDEFSVQKYFTKDTDEALQILSKNIYQVDASGCSGLSNGATAEGLTAALELFNDMKTLSGEIAPNRYCILLTNTSPHTHASAYGSTLSQITEQLQQQSIPLSIIIPRRGFKTLESLIQDDAFPTQDAAVSLTHFARVKGFSLPLPKNDRKRQHPDGPLSPPPILSTEESQPNTPTTINNNTSNNNNAQPQQPPPSKKAKVVGNQDSPSILSPSIQSPQQQSSTTPTSNTTPSAPLSSKPPIWQGTVAIQGKDNGFKALAFPTQKANQSFTEQDYKSSLWPTTLKISGVHNPNIAMIKSLSDSIPMIRFSALENQDLVNKILGLLGNKKIVTIRFADSVDSPANNFWSHEQGIVLVQSKDTLLGLVFITRPLSLAIAPSAPTATNPTPSSQNFASSSAKASPGSQMPQQPQQQMHQQQHAQHSQFNATQHQQFQALASAAMNGQTLTPQQLTALQLYQQQQYQQQQNYQAQRKK